MMDEARWGEVGGRGRKRPIKKVLVNDAEENREEDDGDGTAVAEVGKRALMNSVV